MSGMTGKEKLMSSYTKPRRRRLGPPMDALPEQMHYIDTGCEASMSCLECPLPRCKFDDPVWYQAYRRRERDEEIASACIYENLQAFEAANRFGVSVRTVQRALRRLHRHQLLPNAA